MSAFRYPVVLDLEGRSCLVVGGGAVAARKARALLAAGARVTVVSPRLAPELLEAAAEGRLRWWPRRYADGDPAGFFLVLVAAGDGTVSDRVAREARARGVLVNCADDPERCDFILPSVLRRGAITVAVSTGGASPLMARRVREELETLLPAHYGALTELVAGVRRSLRDRGVSPGAARWAGALDEELRRLVAAGRLEQARERLQGRLGV